MGDHACWTRGTRHCFLDWYYQMATPTNQEVEQKPQEEASSTLSDSSSTWYIANQTWSEEILSPSHQKQR